MDTRTTDLSRRMALFEPSRSVTEILNLAERPDVISLAGGLPDPAVFDLDAIRESMDRVLRDEGAAALNYGPNAGYGRLREWIASRMAERCGVSLSPENILVVSGGVDGLNLCAMALLDKRGYCPCRSAHLHDGASCFPHLRSSHRPGPSRRAGDRPGRSRRASSGARSERCAAPASLHEPVVPKPVGAHPRPSASGEARGALPALPSAPRRRPRLRGARL